MNEATKDRIFQLREAIVADYNNQKKKKWIRVTNDTRCPSGTMLWGLWLDETLIRSGDTHEVITSAFKEAAEMLGREFFDSRDDGHPENVLYRGLWELEEDGTKNLVGGGYLVVCLSKAVRNYHGFCEHSVCTLKALHRSRWCGVHTKYGANE